MDFNDPLLRADAVYIERMLEDKILVPMSSSAFPAEEGTLIIMCSDGDQHQNVMLRHWAQSNGRPCHHPLALNGLPLMIAPSSKIACHGESAVVLEHACGACKIKGPQTAVIYGHWPCGIGFSNGLPIWEQLALYSDGKEALRSHLKEHGFMPEVICGIHIHHGYGKKHFKELYHFHRHQWLVWHQTVGRDVVSELKEESKAA
jgi:hypothetical protein